MKTPDQAVAEVRTRLQNRWVRVVAGHDPDAWPHLVALGQPTRTQLEADFPAARQWALNWTEWAAEHRLTLHRQNRTVIGTTQPLPTHLEIPDLDTAARLAGQDWPQRLATAYRRATTLASTFPHTDLTQVLPSVQQLTDIEFDLLLDAGRWFAIHDATGMTPRQVPIAGLHGKWLNRHHGLLRHLAGKDDLGLISRPTRVHFTYLDPAHLASGGRRHESVTIGDLVTPAYTPATVIVLENKDTAVYFPPIPGAIAVEGEGNKATGTLARLPWLRQCPQVFYWGDIDAAGYVIVNNLRLSGVDAKTILMDQPTYDAFERFGAWTDEKGKPIPCLPRRNLTALAAHEQAVYENLTDAAWTRVRRIEQERIPMHLAVAQIQKDAQ